MTIQYQVDGNIFQEITSNWLCAYVNEYLIKARRLDTDQAGNTVEHFQLNDGRMFTRLVRGPQVINAAKASGSRPRNRQAAIREHSAAHSR